MASLLFPAFRKACVTAGMTVEHVMHLLDELATGIVLVVNEENHLVATVTDGDIRRGLLMHIGVERPISDLLEGKSSPITAAAGTSRGGLLAAMRDHRVQQLPLIDSQGRVSDLALLKRLQEEGEPEVQALIMAGGFGSRLMPLTQDTPKPMLPVGGRPLLELTVERLVMAGIRNVNVSTHYLPEKITKHFGDGSRFGVKMQYFQEDRPMGTGGALTLLGEIKQTTLVINGDVVTDLDFRAMMEFHNEHNAAATMAVANYDVRIPYGVIQHEGVNVTGLSEKPVISNFINAGIYLVEPSVMQYSKRDQVFNMTDLIEALIANGKRVVVFPVREYWIDVGQHADYEQAQRDISNGLVRNSILPTY